MVLSQLDEEGLAGTITGIHSQDMNPSTPLSPLQGYLGLNQGLQRYEYWSVARGKLVLELEAQKTSSVKLLFRACCPILLEHE